MTKTNLEGLTCELVGRETIDHRVTDDQHHHHWCHCHSPLSPSLVISTESIVDSAKCPVHHCESRNESEGDPIHLVGNNTSGQWAEERSVRAHLYPLVALSDINAGQRRPDSACSPMSDKTTSLQAVSNHSNALSRPLTY